MNPYVIAAILVIWGGSLTLTGYKAFELGKAESSETWQKKWDGQVVKEQEAITQADGDRQVLQNLANQLGKQLADTEQQRDRYFNKLTSKTHEDAKNELPADDRVCDLPPSLLNDWDSASSDPRQVEGGVSSSGSDGQVSGSPKITRPQSGAVSSKPY